MSSGLQSAAGLLFDCQEYGDLISRQISVQQLGPMQLAGLWSCLHHAMHTTIEVSSLLNSKVSTARYNNGSEVVPQYPAVHAPQQPGRNENGNCCRQIIRPLPKQRSRPENGSPEQGKRM